MLALRVAYYAAVALADELHATGADVYDCLTARNAVHEARVALDEDNFLRGAVAVDADDEGRWADASMLPAVVEFTTAEEEYVAPHRRNPTPDFAYRVHLYSVAAERPRHDDDRRPLSWGLPWEIARATAVLSPRDESRILTSCVGGVSL